MLWRNGVTTGLNKLNQTMESVLPNYYTQQEITNRENGEWYKNIFSANFLGDAILKNSGFMIGAALAGQVVSGAALKAMKLAEARKAYNLLGVVG